MLQVCGDFDDDVNIVINFVFYYFVANEYDFI